jgi:hypothetical protein
MRFVKLCRTAVVVASLGMAAAVVTAPAAGAAISQGRIQLCSQGNYGSWLSYSAPGNSSIGTDTVRKGSCKTYSVPAAGATVWTVTIHGVYNTSQSSFTLGTTQSSPSHAGLKIATTGTTTSPGWKFLPNDNPPLACPHAPASSPWC